MVGNPGHPVRVEGRPVEGPDADWIHLPDPIAEAIKALSERIAELERRLAELDGERRPRREVDRAAPDAGADPRPAAEPAGAAAILGRGPRSELEIDARGGAERRRGAPIEAGADRVERLLADLNPPQREAVDARRGAAAGPGRRRLGQDPGRSPTGSPTCSRPAGRGPSEILAITFTNKAAERDARAGRGAGRRRLAARCG